MGILVQVIATFILGMSSMNLVINYSWPSSTILLFKSENTTLNRPMGNVEIGLLNSLSSAGSLISLPLLIGTVLDRLGRKGTVMLTSFFLVVAWFIRALVYQVEAILFAAFLSGLGNAIFILVAIYISEISQDGIRGTLLAGVNQGGLGLLVSYYLGGALEYHTLVYTNLTLAVIGFLMIAMLKEPPVSYLAKGKDEEAAKSLAFYRCLSSNCKEVKDDLNNIRRTLNCHSNETRSLTLLEEKVKPELLSKNITCWQLFKTNYSIRKQFYLVIILNTTAIWQGLLVVLVYAKPIFATALSDAFYQNLCSALLGFVVAVAGIVGTCLYDKVGRRPLQIYSCLACGVCCVIIGIQILTEWFPKLTMPLFICIYAAFHTIGPGTVTYTIGAEIFIPEVKSALLTITEEWTLVCQFSSLFIFNTLQESIGLSTVFFFFAFVSCNATIYSYYFLPETKGLSVYAIQALFNKK